MHKLYLVRAIYDNDGDGKRTDIIGIFSDDNMAEKAILDDIDHNILAYEVTDYEKQIFRDHQIKEISYDRTFEKYTYNRLPEEEFDHFLLIKGKYFDMYYGYQILYYELDDITFLEDLR